MNYDDCTNPGQPCHLHDRPEDWQIVVFNRTVNTAWFLIVLAVVVAVSTLPGLN